MSEKETFIASLDVESIGLYGDPTAWAVVVYDSHGQCLEEYAVQLDRVHKEAKQFNENRDGDRAWYRDNVDPATTEASWNGVWGHRLKRNLTQYAFSVDELCQAFRERWSLIVRQYQGVVLLADCPFPVETNFLRRAMGPGEIYPLIDVNTLAHVAGIQTFPRKPHELPIHNPLADARQSGRIYFELIAEVERLRAVEAVVVDYVKTLKECDDEGAAINHKHFDQLFQKAAEAARGGGK